jgi:short-subunit dehydrogenase
MADFTGRTALITGASAGIGVALAKDLSARGARVILVARRADRLAALAATLGQGAIAAPCDLTNELERKALAVAHPDVDILVNNAGLGVFGLFAEQDWAALETMLTVNITALTHLTHLFAKPMIARNYGRILNVGSTAAFSPVPMFAGYAATKAYVLSFSEALDVEFKPHNVRVTALCPGGTESEFFTVAAMDISKATGGMMSAEAVAKIGVDALVKGQSSVVAGLANALMAFGTRLSPRAFNAKVAYKLMK